MKTVRSAASPDEPRPIRIFLWSCDHLKSEQYCEELEKHLSPLIREKQVEIQQSHKILAGLVEKDAIICHVDSADIIGLCISSSLFSSDLNWEIMKRAITLRDEGKVRVIPIKASPADYKATRLRELQALPRRRKPLSQLSSPDREAAFAEIAEEIRKVMEDLLAGMMREEKVAKEETVGQSGLNDPALYKAQGDMFFRHQQYDEALAAYHKAISLNPDFADALRAVAEVYRTLASLTYEKLNQLKEMDPPDDTREGLEQ